MAAFAAKAALGGVAEVVRLAGQKTMYGGVRIAEGDEVFLFADEARGGTPGARGACDEGSRQAAFLVLSNGSEEVTSALPGMPFFHGKSTG